MGCPKSVLSLQSNVRSGSKQSQVDISAFLLSRPIAEALDELLARSCMSPCTSFVDPSNNHDASRALGISNVCLSVKTSDNNTHLHCTHGFQDSFFILILVHLVINW